MKYMLMICEDRSLPDRTADEEAEVMSEYERFTRKILDSGEMVGGEQLARPETATSIRVRGGERAILDGPFSESAEQIGGFYIVDVEDIDRAIELAAKIPSARTGVVEIRPLHQP